MIRSTRSTPDVNGPTVSRGASVPSYARDDLLAAVRALAPKLRAASDEIEAGRSLTEPLVQAMVDAGFYRLYLPRSLGGGELDPLTYFDVIEALTHVESTAGWSTLISTGAMTITSRGLTDEVLARCSRRRGRRSWRARDHREGAPWPCPAATGSPDAGRRAATCDSPAGSWRAAISTMATGRVLARTGAPSI